MEVSRFKSIALVLLACLLTTVLSQAQAATLQVSPVKIDFAVGQNAAGLDLNNPGDTPVYAQVRVFSWNQNADGDVLGPSEEVMASPPIIQLAGHGRQLIRLIKVKALNENVEQSYRLLIDEIPPPGTDQHSGVAIRMRYSIPVFIAAKTEVAAQLNWQVMRQGEQWWLRVDNRGLRHSQVGALTVQDAAGRVVQVSNGLLGYALAGHVRQWPLHNVGTAKLEGPLLIKVNLDGRPSTLKVTGEG